MIYWNRGQGTDPKHDSIDLRSEGKLFLELIVVGKDFNKKCTKVYFDALKEAIGYNQIKLSEVPSAFAHNAVANEKHKYAGVNTAKSCDTMTTCDGFSGG